MNSQPEFIFFGTAHIVTLMIITGLCFAVPAVAGQIKDSGWSQAIVKTMAVVLVVALAAKMWWLAFEYELPWERLLPLQICDVNIILCALMLLFCSYRLYEVAYFWAIAGSIAAMLMPDLPYGFPHFSFIIFYLDHGLAVVGVLYATFIFGFQPQLRSVVTAIIVTGLYALTILAVNFVLDTNYLYLRTKPAATSILDYLGPWPWYVLGLGGLTVISCFLCYMPFALVRYFRKRQGHNS